MTEADLCQVKGCENEASVTVEIMMPGWLNDDTFIPPEHRKGSARFCKQHRDYVLNHDVPREASIAWLHSPLNGDEQRSLTDRFITKRMEILDRSAVVNDSNPHEAYDLVYGNDNPEGPAHAWIQWKGTDVCMDLHCICGAHGHIDGDFVYSVQCRDCGRKYAVGQNVKLIELDTPELQAANEQSHGDYRDFGDDD